MDPALRDGRDAGLSWLLELTDSSITYRSRYLSSPEWLPVLDLIVRDGGVPGVTVRLPKSFAKVAIEPGNRVRAGAAAMFDRDQTDRAEISSLFIVDDRAAWEWRYFALSMS